MTAVGRYRLAEQRRLADENLVAAFDLVRRHVGDPRARMERFGAVVAIRTGIDIGFYNPVLALGFCAALDDVVAAMDGIESAGLPTSVHLSADADAALGADLIARRLERDPWVTPVMALQLTRALLPTTGPAELRIRTGGDELFEDWHTAVGQSTVFRRVIGPDFMADGAVRVAVGDLDGEPVGHAAVVGSGRTIGVYAVGTLPHARRRGYGRAITRAAIAAGVAAWGGDLAILQSSEVGVPVYASMGFVEIDRIAEYGRPRASAGAA